MTAHKLLARSTAVLARIDQALDDPYPALVANLPGVAGADCGCFHDEVVQVGSIRPVHPPTLWFVRDIENDNADWCDIEVPYPSQRCWGDALTWNGCCKLTPLTDDVGLCAAHYAEIVGES
jgi:hypothetical protein